MGISLGGLGLVRLFSMHLFHNLLWVARALYNQGSSFGLVIRLQSGGLRGGLGIPASRSVAHSSSMS